MNVDSTFLVPNKLQVSDVNEHASRLANHKHEVLPVNGIRQQDYSTADTEVPEHRWHNASFFAFAAKPLHDESGCEQELPGQTECYPDLFARHKLDPSFQQPVYDYGAKAMRHL